MSDIPFGFVYSMFMENICSILFVFHLADVALLFCGIILGIRMGSPWIILESHVLDYSYSCIASCCVPLYHLKGDRQHLALDHWVCDKANHKDYYDKQYAN